MNFTRLCLRFRAGSRENLYAAGIGLASVSQWLADALDLAVACMGLIPERRISRKLD